MKLDLACGQHKKDGFFGVDKVDMPGVDRVHDLLTWPWPFSDNTASEVWCSHYFEHVPGRFRAAFMDELWRICRPDAKVTITCPYWTSKRSIQDFTHEWPPICEDSFLYFNRQVRERSGLTHYGIACDFDLDPCYIDELGDLLMVLKARK